MNAQQPTRIAPRARPALVLLAELTQRKPGGVSFYLMLDSKVHSGATGDLRKVQFEN